MTPDEIAAELAAALETIRRVAEQFGMSPATAEGDEAE